MTRIRRRAISAYRRRPVFGALLTVGLLVGLAAGLVVGLIGVPSSQASTPASSSVTVPSTVGQTVTDTWTGAIPAGSNATSNCGPVADTAVVDQHLVTVNVPAGYNTVQANFTSTSPGQMRRTTRSSPSSIPTGTRSARAIPVNRARLCARRTSRRASTR